MAADIVLRATLLLPFIFLAGLALGAAVTVAWSALRPDHL